MKKPTVLLFLLTMLGLFSCGNSYVLSPEQMEDLLVDIHLADGITLQNSDFKKTDAKLDLYSTIYKKHHTDKAQFDSSMIYYSENLTDFAEIYEAVFDRLTQLEVEVQVGNYAATTAPATKAVNARIANADLDILPYVQKEYWPKNREIIFTDKEFEHGAKVNVLLDTLIHPRMEMRMSLEAMGVTQATCNLEFQYDGDDVETRNFDIPLSDENVAINWSVQGSPNKIAMTFTAEKDTLDEVSFILKDCRVYEVSQEAHNIYLFN